MVKIEVLIRPFKLDEVSAVLEGLGIEKLTISEVAVHGGSASPTMKYRGTVRRVGFPMLKLEILAPMEQADELIEDISRAARTSLPGDDGTILVYRLADAVRVKGGDRLEFLFAGALG
jgi:nitrogen regulatory protein P-II 1